MKCARCGAENTPEDTFCTNCGAMLVFKDAQASQAPRVSGYCTKCGSALEPGQTFCTTCGERVAGQSGTVLANDVGATAQHAPLSVSTPQFATVAQNVSADAGSRNVRASKAPIAVVAGIAALLVGVAIGGVAIGAFLQSRNTATETEPVAQAENVTLTSAGESGEQSGETVGSGAAQSGQESSASVEHSPSTASDTATAGSASVEEAEARTPADEPAPNNAGTEPSASSGATNTDASNPDATNPDAPNPYGMGGTYEVDSSGLVLNKTFMFKFRIPAGYRGEMLTNNTVQFKGNDFTVTFDAWFNNGETQESRYNNARSALVETGYETQSDGVFVVTGRDARGHDKYIKEIVLEDRICRMVVDSSTYPCSPICEDAITEFEGEFRLLN